MPRSAVMVPSVAMNGRDAQADDQRAVQRTRAGADASAGASTAVARAGAALQRFGDHDRRERHRGADGEIDAAVNDDQRHADGGDATRPPSAAASSPGSTCVENVSGVSAENSA